jgi:hypothetical protein
MTHFSRGGKGQSGTILPSQCHTLVIGQKWVGESVKVTLLGEGERKPVAIFPLEGRADACTDELISLAQRTFAKLGCGSLQ